MQRIIDQALVEAPQKPGKPRFLRDAQGQKVYICTNCSKMFPTPAMLRRHEMIHTGERPYRCEQCGKTFQQKVHLTGHTRRVHSQYVINSTQTDEPPQ